MFKIVCASLFFCAVVYASIDKKDCNNNEMIELNITQCPESDPCDRSVAVMCEFEPCAIYKGRNLTIGFRFPTNKVFDDTIKNNDTVEAHLYAKINDNQLEVPHLQTNKKDGASYLFTVFVPLLVPTTDAKWSVSLSVQITNSDTLQNIACARFSSTFRD